MTRLRIVPADQSEVVNIYTAWRAEVAAINWDAMHIRAGKREPVELGNRPKRSWR